MDKVQHFEIPADDLDRAKQFYNQVFGWRLVDMPMGETTYTMAYTTEVDDKHMPTTPGVINGGLFPRGNSPMTGPTIAVTVEDIDATLEKLQAAGGSVLGPKMQVADMGLYAYVKDTEGNIIGVWQELKKKE